MNRNDKILCSIDRSMRILELGPLTSPIAPKSDGWLTTVVDHVSREQLVEKYRNDSNVDTSRIVDIDIVWSQGPLEAAVPRELHGTFDAFIASHVFEHIPDPIGLLHSLEQVLRPAGVVSLVIPDKRFCFDFFRPLSTAGGLLDAHARGAVRHSRKAVFDEVAYSIRADGDIAFSRRHLRDIDFVHPLEQAKAVFDGHSSGEDAPYVDIHGWQFTPSSFALAMLELSALNAINFTVVRSFPTEGFEFYVTLRRGRVDHGDADVLQARRLNLLQRTLEELREQAGMLDERGGFTDSRVVEAARPVTTPPWEERDASRVLLGGHDADGHYLGGESTSVVQDLSSWLSTDGLEVAPDEEVSHFWRLATETWRISRGLKPLSIEHPELSARLVPRNGFRPSSWGELAGSIDQIRVRQLGAMGNSVIQIMNARDLARQFGISDLAVSDAWFLPTGRSDLHGGVRLMNLDSARAQEAGQAQAGVSVLGNFFRSSEFAPVLGVSPEEEFERLINGLVGLADIDDLARLVNNHLDVGDPLSADHLVIHVRAGDVFRDGEVPGYGQPPLAYYLKILGSRPWAAVSVVFEDASNPVIAPLVEHVRRSPVDCDIVSGQLEHDVGFLLRARTLVAGRGTFIPAVSALSKYAEVVYCFERLLGAVGGKRLQVKPVIDVSGAYVRSVMNYNWTNSEEQRKLMLEYAVDDLAWQES